MYFIKLLLSQDERDEFLKKEIKKFPNLPGIYRMMNGKNEIIYIGKAKDIKKRVASYFGKNHSNDGANDKI